MWALMRNWGRCQTAQIIDGSPMDLSLVGSPGRDLEQCDQVLVEYDYCIVPDMVLAVTH